MGNLRGEDVLEKLAHIPYQDAKSMFKSGDILLCSGNGAVSTLIKEMTNGVFSHTAILLELPITGQWLVLESIESIGVRCVTLEDGYLKNYKNTNNPYDGTLVLARHQDMEDISSEINLLYQKAFELTGELYSEADIFRIATRIALNKLGIQEDGRIIDDNKYICSEYVYVCLAILALIKILQTDQK
jgi:hypothetical protein